MNTTNKLEIAKKDITNLVLSKINIFEKSGQLKIPKDYSPENALKSAYLILLETKNKDGKYALDHCTQESLANALLKMVVWGISPLKKQCYFMMYGDKLDCGIEYTGNIILAKRYGNLKSIKGNAIFKEDEFSFEIDPISGLKKVTTHKQSLDSIGSKDLRGAYAIIEMNDGKMDTEIMNIHQIRDSWNQGAMKGNSPAHRNFPDQMAIKTVINRACKLLIRGSNDSILYDTEDRVVDITKEDVDHEIKENANKEEIGFKEKKRSSEKEDEKPKFKEEDVFPRFDENEKPRFEKGEDGKIRFTEDEKPKFKEEDVFPGF